MITPPAVSPTASLFADLAIIIPVLALLVVAASLCSSHARNAAVRALQRVLAPLYGPPELHEEVARLNEAAPPAEGSEDESDAARERSDEFFRERELGMLAEEMFREQ